MTNPTNLYVIIQAGGRGSRLRHHTWNKPKCLVSVHGKPIIYHAFDYFPNATFIIIGDYAFSQLEKYLKTNPPTVAYKLIHTTNKGTASGIAQALDLIPSDSRVVLMWSDLIIKSLPNFLDRNLPVVFTTSSFTCRWTISEEGVLRELPASINGIPGIFYFPNKDHFITPPTNGEFVKWFSITYLKFETIDCPDLEELGDFHSIEENNDRAGFSRFFNKVEISKNSVTKTVLDPNYQDLQSKEIAWYGEVQKLKFRRIPKVFTTNPFVIERINGLHAYEMHDLTEREKRAVMADYLDTLTSLHDSKSTQTITEDAFEVYLNKTINRINSVSGIIPAFEKDSMTINGKKCKNLFSDKYEGELQKIISNLVPKKFTAIHGDPTFSNTLVDDNLRVWFFDPRGYFANPGIMGDPLYDFAKVYYSAVGGYDLFNRRKFKLHIDEHAVEILQADSIFAKTAPQVFANYFSEDFHKIQLIHGLIWLSLSGYAKDDIDSVIGAFYYGLYWLELAQNKKTPTNS
ncbi:sugar phosphate nucleotidyltransferase [Polynucleobacter necessarius]|uniref:sugar phosphate nucleotidyltransferase n=1 Tax=Polynucleobacter necessarius TaxID=576610 RepID=UPI000E09D38B|nr:sugar phosphate nucleotidyltransferase [Polynucleobacter necessarius]